MMRRWAGYGYAFAMLMGCVMLMGCAESSGRIVVYTDTRSEVSLMVDPAAGQGHSHPARVSRDTVARVMRGIRVRDRNAIVGFGLLERDMGTPAFTETDVTRLAGEIARALGQASPRDLVTFYLTERHPSKGPLVTSGGLFIRGDYLYFILANARTEPSATSNDFSFAAELDNHDQPLEPIGRFRFSVAFNPSSVQVPYGRARQLTDYEGYVDEAKLAVLTLPRLMETGEDQQPPPGKE